MKIKIYFLFFFLTIMSCQDLVKKEKIIGNYYLISVDTRRHVSLSYELESGNYLGVITSGVRKVVKDNHYIFVKTYEGYYVIPAHLDYLVDNKNWIDTLKSKLLTVKTLKKYPFDKDVDINGILLELNKPDGSDI